MHFGAAAKVGLFTLDTAGRRIVRFDVTKPPVRLPCGWGNWLGARGVTVFLAGAISEGALQRLAAGGLKVVAGVRPEVPLTLVQAWLTGTLRPGANGCEAGQFAAAAPTWSAPTPRDNTCAGACCCLRGLVRAQNDVVDCRS